MTMLQSATETEDYKPDAQKKKAQIL